MLNVHTCLYGNIVSGKFGIPPPSLREYFQGSPRTDSSMGSTHIERIMWHMCYNIGISIIIMIYNIGISKKKQFI